MYFGKYVPTFRNIFLLPSSESFKPTAEQIQYSRGRNFVNLG